MNYQNRSEEYWDGLEKRVGFAVRDGQADLVNVVGVTFEGRQSTLGRVRDYCRFGSTPPVQLIPDPENPHDSNAVRVLIGYRADELTGEFEFKDVGYLPIRRCPICASSFGKKDAQAQICSSCDAHIGLGSHHSIKSFYNKWIITQLLAGQIVNVGLDNITQAQNVNSSTMGCALWIKTEE